jgi:putative FmdB family regulatory protein
MRLSQATKLPRNRCIFADFFKIMRRFRSARFHENGQMPIYEYRCDNCAHEFETIQKLSEAPLETCPACSADALRKKISASGFRLKGGGWYETDFKAGSKRNVAGDDKGANSSKNSGEGASGNGGETSSGSNGGGKAESGTSSGGDAGKSGGDAKGGASKSGAKSGAKSDAKSGPKSDTSS